MLAQRAYGARTGWRRGSLGAQGGGSRWHHLVASVVVGLHHTTAAAAPARPSRRWGTRLQVLGRAASVATTAGRAATPKLLPPVCVRREFGSPPVGLPSGRQGWCDCPPPARLASRALHTGKGASSAKVSGVGRQPDEATVICARILTLGFWFGLRVCSFFVPGKALEPNSRHCKAATRGRGPTACEISTGSGGLLLKFFHPG